MGTHTITYKVFYYISSILSLFYFFLFYLFFLFFFILLFFFLKIIFFIKMCNVVKMLIKQLNCNFYCATNSILIYGKIFLKYLKI